ncbi:hypothetical protein CBW24_15675 (plasmid) [Pacificitalea manganoxidans]|uniref:Uncharacterized protein n=1 Tax=Pacificitalea manganoxidans TaxID=1411902 RepID=A0A291M412_9RHOB|nr:hypothetical protein [Pacificitalea manganoxidans]ATI43587.1 hypothetical protein CBW24_15675 [Pacificitalea manganoxidans]MDR6309975.1 hypothetical protein [Pacificitalea manganoxidans]
MSKTTPFLTLGLVRAPTPPAPTRSARTDSALASLRLSDLAHDRGLPRFGAQTGLLEALFDYIEAGGARLPTPPSHTPSTEIRA